MRYEKNIFYFTIKNDNGVIGIAYVKKNFKAQIHQHREEETYIFLEGAGRLHLNNKEKIISNEIINIPSNAKHAMTPVTDYVLLIFMFNNISFQNIKYKYFDKSIL